MSLHLTWQCYQMQYVHWNDHTIMDTTKCRTACIHYFQKGESFLLRFTIKSVVYYGGETYRCIEWSQVFMDWRSLETLAPNKGPFR